MGMKDDFLTEILNDLDNEGETPIVEDFDITETDDFEDFIETEDSLLKDSSVEYFDEFVLNKPKTLSEVLNVEKYKQFYEFMESKSGLKHTITGGIFYLYAKGNLLKSLDFNENYKYYNHYKECLSLSEEAIKKYGFKEFKSGSLKEHYDPLVFFTNKQDVFNLLFAHFFKERILFIPSSFNEEWFLSKVEYYRKKYDYNDDKNEYMRTIIYYYNKYNNTYISEQEKGFENNMNEILCEIIK